MTEPRWDAIDKLPDDMHIYGSDHTEAPLTPDVWRDALGHPRAAGRSYCMTCGPAMRCWLIAFFDATIASTIRELDKAGMLVPERKETEK